MEIHFWKGTYSHTLRLAVRFCTCEYSDYRFFGTTIIEDVQLGLSEMMKTHQLDDDLYTRELYRLYIYMFLCIYIYILLHFI